MTLNFYSSDLDREFEIDVDLHFKQDSSFFQINGIYEKDLNIDRQLHEFCLADRVMIKNKCKEALEDYHFSDDDKAPRSLTHDSRY